MGLIYIYSHIVTIYVALAIDRVSIWKNIISTTTARVCRYKSTYIRDTATLHTLPPLLVLVNRPLVAPVVGHGELVAEEEDERLGGGLDLAVGDEAP